MKPVVCFGEALIDFLLTEKTEDGPLSLPNFRQYPGGAPANAAVAVAKLGGDARFAGQVGADGFGKFLIDALNKYGVDTRFLTVHPTARTPLAFVTLDDSGERSFSFHRHETSDIVFSRNQIRSEWFANRPIFHFCSNTLTDTKLARVTGSAVESAVGADALVSFDVNLRHSLWAGNQADRQAVNEFVFSAHVLKFAAEELEYLADRDQTAYLRRCLNSGARLILVTDGPNPVRYITSEHDGYVDSPSVKAVDTTAAGDAFSGAILYGLSRATEYSAVTSGREHLEALVEFAVQCSSLTVTRSGAFPSLPVFNEVRRHWNDMP